MIEIRRIETGKLRANCYIVVGAGGELVIVDPGDQFELIAAAIADVAHAEVRAVLCTHAHFDHVGAAAAACERYGVALHLHDDDLFLLRRAGFVRRVIQGEGTLRIPSSTVSLVDGAELSFGSLGVEVLHTPGHSPGSVCFAADSTLFAGDTVNAGGLGRTDILGGDAQALEASFQRLIRAYPPDTLVRPGHGTPFRLGELSGAAGGTEMGAGSERHGR